MEKVKGYELKLRTQEELEEELARIGCDEKGISIMAPRGRFYLIKLTGVPLRAALILKQEMLAKGGEAALPWQASALNVETCPVLLMGSKRIFQILLQILPHQPFGLSSIGEIIQSLLEKPELKEIETNRGLLSFQKTPLIMGILNYTPDSFYDGGKYYSLKTALDRALEMEEEGADILDIGGESTRPGSLPLTLDEELFRVLPLLEGVLKKTSIPISVDTYKGRVAEEVLKAGASIINDISGLHFDEEVGEAVARYKTPIVLMHIKGEPKTMQEDPSYTDLFREISAYLEEGIEKAKDLGISKEKIILDPGIGFGKKLKHNLQIIRDLEFFSSLGSPLLIGPSRKSFIGKTLDLPLEERLEGTAAAVAISVMNGANIIRVHDVKEMKRVVRMAYAISRGYH